MSVSSGMSVPPGDDDEPPLDPALLRVQARLRGLMLIGGGTLALGMFAVFAAILYRIAADDATDVPVAFAPGAPVPTLDRAALALPAGATLVSVAAGEGRIVLAYRHGRGESVVVLDAATLVPLNRIDIGAHE